MGKVNLKYSALSGNQISLFKDFKADELQTYITQLQAAKQASKGVFDAATVSTYANAIQGLEAKQAALLLSTQGLTNAQIAETLAVNESNVAKNYQAMADAGLLARKQKLTLAQVQENLQTVLGSEADAKAAMAAMGLSMATAEEGNQVVKLSAKKMQAAISSHKLTEAEAKELAMRTGVTLSIKAQVASTLPKWIAMLQAATKAIWGQIKATAVWMATNPIGWATAAIAAIGAVIAGLNKLAKAEKEASDKAQESYEKSKERTQSNKEEARSLDELIKKYEELKSVSDMDSDTRSEIKELQYDIMELVGGEVQNLDLVNGALDEQLIKLKEIAAEKARQNAEDAKDSYYQSRHAAEKLTGNNDDYGNDASISEAELYDLLGIAYDVSKGSNIDAEGKVVYWADILHSFTDQFGDIVRDSDNLFSRDIVVDTNGISNIEDRIRRLEELKEHVGDMGLRKSDFYASITDSISYYEDQYNNELEAASTLTESLIDNLYFSNEKLAEITVDSVDGFEQYRQTMISEMKNDETISEAMADGVLSDEAIEKAVNDFMATATQFSEWYEQWKGEINNESTVNKNSIPLFDQLTTSKDAFDKFQSSVKSAADAYSTLMSGNYSSSDMLDSIQAINAAVSDMGGSLDWEFIDSQTQLNSLDLLGGAIKHITQKYAESVLSGAGIDVDSKFGQMLANNIIQAQKASTQLEVLDDQIDSLQSAYSDLTDIVDMYNKTGSITFDQLQVLLEMEPQYLSCLIDENGQLQLNESAMVELANKRLDDAEAQAVQQAITELGQLALQDEKKAVQENAEAFTNAVNDLSGYNAELANTIAEATVGAAAIRDLNAAISGAESQGANDTQINTVLDNLNTKLQLIDSVRDKVASGGLGSVVKSGSKSKSEKDTTKEFDWIEQAIENVEKEVKSLDDVVNSAYSTFSQKNEALAKEIGKVSEEIDLQQQAYEGYMRKADSTGLSDHYKGLVHDGAINIENISDKNLQEKISDYQQWYDKAVDASDAISELSTKVKDLHVAGFELQADRLEELLDSESITEKQYLEEMEKLYKEYYENQVGYAQKAHEAKLALLDKEKSYLNSVANAATSLLDKEIDKIRDNADAQQKPLNNQIDAYNEQIDLLNKKKKPLQDELDALEDKARQENLILDLQKKQYNLKRAENQRTKLLYSEGKGIYYENDPQAIRSAQKDVDDAKLEIQKNDIQKQIDALDDEIDRYNDLIDLVNDQIDVINKAADNQINALEKIKNKWQEVIDQQEYAKNVSLLTGEFGTNAISKILTGNDDDLLAQWKDSYINTLANIDMESQGYIGNMTQQIASLYGVDLSPLQNQFQNVKDSVNGMTDALSAAASAVGIDNVSGDTSNPATQNNAPASSTGTETSLESAIVNETETAMNAFDQHTDKLNNEVTPAIQTAAQEMDTFNETAGTDIEKTVTIHYETTGDPEPASNIAVKKARVGKVYAGKAFAEGTTGKAFAAGNDGLSHDEKNALRSEYGQPELTVYPDGNYEITTDPVISDLPKGTTVYNEEQTREIMSRKSQIDGNIGAVVGNDVVKPNGDTLKPDGTVIKPNGVTIKPDGTIITPKGEVYEPLRPGDRMYDMLQKFQNYFSGLESRGETMYNSALVDHQKQMEQMINQITNHSSVVNNTKNVQPVVNHNQIHVTLPNVTDSTCAQELLRDLQSINLKKFQVNW